MKCLKYLLCTVILAGGLCMGPIGCGPGKAEKIDPAGFEPGPEDGPEEEDDGNYDSESGYEEEE